MQLAALKEAGVQDHTDFLSMANFNLGSRWQLKLSAAMLLPKIAISPPPPNPPTADQNPQKPQPKLPPHQATPDHRHHESHPPILGL